MQNKLFKITQAVFIRNTYLKAVKKISKYLKNEYTADEFTHMIFRSDQLTETLNKYNLEYSYNFKTRKLSIYDKSRTVISTVRLLTNEQNFKKLEVKYER